MMLVPIFKQGNHYNYQLGVNKPLFVSLREGVRQGKVIVNICETDLKDLMGGCLKVGCLPQGSFWMEEWKNKC